MKKTVTYISIGILSLLFVYGFYIMSIKTRLINEGIRVFINYYYENKIVVVDYIEEYIERKKLLIGKRIFIKFIPGHDIEYVKLDIDCIVPDSIKHAPSNGWSEQWMKDNFPDYLVLINKY